MATTTSNSSNSSPLGASTFAQYFAAVGSNQQTQSSTTLPTPSPTTTGAPATTITGSTGPQVITGSNLSLAARNPFTYNPTVTNEQDYGITSKPDIEALVNSAMQSLVGRFATPAEIAQYGAELLAAEKANPGTYNSVATYDVNTGKRNVVTGTRTSTGVDANSFIQNLIMGTGEYKQYNVLNNYMGALKNLNDQTRQTIQA